MADQLAQVHGERGHQLINDAGVGLRGEKWSRHRVAVTLSPFIEQNVDVSTQKGC